MITIQTRLHIERFRRKLDRWELPHLREHAAHLAMRADRQRRLIEALKVRLRHAEDNAYAAWHMLDVERMIAHEREEHPGRDLVVAITPDGSIGVVERPVEWHPC